MSCTDAPLAHYFLSNKIAVVHTATQGSFKYEADLKELSQLLSRALIEQLIQLVDQGPVWEDDILSKSDRDSLLKLGLAVRICVKGAQGYTAATYLGYEVLQVGE